MRIIFEIGFEELPPLSLILLRTDVKDTMHFFKERNLNPESNIFADMTPRRLVIIIDSPSDSTAEETIEAQGPPEKVFYDADGKLTKQGAGFLKSKGLTEKDITLKDGFVRFAQKTGGVRISDLLKNTVTIMLNNATFPKRMRWNDSGVIFPRPIRWILFTEDSKTVDFEFAGVKSDKYTYSNRNTGNQRIEAEQDYEAFLRKHYVIISTDERKKMIRDGFALAGEKGISVIEDDELINEVADLVEYPVCEIGMFNDKFTNLPPDIIIAALKQHQRYFSTRKGGKLSHHFMLVLNSPQSDVPGIVRNNEKVLSARLEDAEFYYNEDIKRTPDQYRHMLSNITFFEGLGSMLDKVKRNAALAEITDKMLNDSMKDFEQISLICKFDLASDMIKDGKEFTKLQGVIGSYYAPLTGFNKAYAHVSAEHYMPRTINDAMPDSYEGTVFSIADKADSISGAFIAGYKPTSSKDPMSVRRDTLSLLYMLVEKRLMINVDELMRNALDIYRRNEVLDEISDYMRKRLENALADRYSADIVRSVMTGRFIPVIIADKARVIADVKDTDDFITMVTGQKRAANILKDINPDVSTHAEGEYENALLNSALKADSAIDKLIENAEYKQALELLLSMRKPIDDFFDNVMVMSDDKTERERRLGLLFFVRNVFLKFADFSSITFD